MSYYIRIQELVLDAWVGIEPHEQRYRPIIFNLVLEISGETGDEHDTIEHTVNYEEMITKIKTLLSENKFNLLETLSTRIAKLMITHPKVKKVEVTAGKTHLLNSKQISVTVTEERA